VLKNWTVFVFTLAVAVSAYAAKDDRWHRHSAFGWAVNAYGQYYLEEKAGACARGPVFGLRLVCTPIREDRAAFDFAAGADGGVLWGDATYHVGSAYADVRAYIWVWGPFYVQGGAGLTFIAGGKAGGVINLNKRNAGKSYFVGPAFQISPAFMVLPEWRRDEIPFGVPSYFRGVHRSWRVLVNLN
jgi:hypothetical protein